MKERPILFNGDMVKAILAGKKTQTRRVIKTGTSNFLGHASPVLHSVSTKKAFFTSTEAQFPDLVKQILKCPFGQLGDRLWVRETAFIAPPAFSDSGNVRDDQGRDRAVSWCASQDSDGEECARSYGLKKTPAIHMPRWASRITLEVTDVRVERLREMNELDAIAEGFHGPFTGTDWFGINQVGRPPSECFAELWNMITPPESNWAANPWVWVVGFKAVTP